MTETTAPDPDNLPVGEHNPDADPIEAPDEDLSEVGEAPDDELAPGEDDDIEQRDTGDAGVDPDTEVEPDDQAPE